MPALRETSKKVPDTVLNLLSAADVRKGFPAGTMAALMQQEVGGNFDKYLTDPTAYHYAAGADGRRVAGHTGKVSTAFGPFGLLESTAADPGYGVKPLSNKNLDEQVRFASDYLAARSKGKEGLAGGLAGYGEGTKYAQQVMSRLPAVMGASAPVMVTEAPTVQATPVQVAQVPSPPELVAKVATAMPPQVTPQAPLQTDAWTQFLQSMPAGEQPAVQVADLNYGPSMPMTTQTPVMGRVPGALTPNFAAFSSWKNKRA